MLDGLTVTETLRAVRRYVRWTNKVTETLRAVRRYVR